MKKLSVVAVVIFILLIGMTYVFIPGEFFISKIIYVQSNRNATLRFLAERSNWAKWWPSSQPNSREVAINDTVFKYKNVAYSIDRTFTDFINTTIQFDENVINGRIHIIPLNNDSLVIEWKSQVITSLNPFKKIHAYFIAKKINKDLGDILESAKHFLEKPKNVYNLKIEHARVKDTLLLSVKKKFLKAPDMNEVYQMIKDIRGYIHNNAVKETNFPMLNVRETKDGFEVMVAIPISKSVKGTDKYIIKRMVPGNILVTEVTGGLKTIENAYKNFEYYVSDYNFSVPAISFESLLTDRTKEADTANWKTRIYYPVR